MKFQITFLILINFSIEYITIPFTSSLTNIENNLSPTEFMLRMFSNELTTKIKIGTPNQNLNFYLDFNSYITYILNSNLKDIKSEEKYYNSQSSTYKEYNNNKEINFILNSFDSGFNSSDFFKLNDKMNEILLKFILVTKNNKDTILNYAGSIGFGPINYEKNDYNEGNLIYQLKKQNLTENYMFTLIFNKNNYNGRIIFGKNIYEKYSDDLFHSSNIVYNYKYVWGWNYFTGFFCNYITSIRSVFIKPNIGFCIAHSNLKDEISRNLKQSISRKKCYEDTIKIYNFFYCDEDVNLDFLNFNLTNAHNIRIKLNYKDLTKVYNGKRYILILFNNLFSSYELHIGLPLLKKYDLIFDQDKKIIGFYNFKIDYKDDYDDEDEKEKEKDDANKKKEEKKIFPEDENKVNYKLYFVFLLVFLISVILYCFFTFYRQNKRKRRNRLHKKDFEYEIFDKI